MKKTVLFVILAVLLIFIGFGSFYKIASENVYIPEDSGVSETGKTEDSQITQIPIESIKGITPEQAEELCYSIMGKADKETGFLFSFGIADAVERNKKQYYVIRASWLVNNSHMSYIGDFFVSADGEEVYSGVALGDEYSIENKIWSKKE